jgi:mannosyltransferase OCH1-like enzyme
MNKLHQIYITDETTTNFPEYTQNCIRILKNKYPDFEYILYDNDMIISLLKENFDKDVLNCYLKLKPYAYKADLARYCILYLYGGLYVDLNILWVRRILWTEDLDFFVFRDAGMTKTNYSSVYNGIIWSKPKSKVLKTAIELVVRNCKNNFYGKTPSHPTGPCVFGQAVSAHLHELNLHNNSGQFMLITNKDPKNLRWGFVTDDDKIMAAWKYKNGIELLNSKTIGFNSWDDYRQRWLHKDVYDESILI